MSKEKPAESHAQHTLAHKRDCSIIKEWKPFLSVPINHVMRIISCTHLFDIGIREKHYENLFECLLCLCCFSYYYLFTLISYSLENFS